MDEKPPKFYDLKGLAAITERSYDFWLDMKKRGLPLYGGKTCIQWAMDWLRQHPDETQAGPA